MLKHIGADRSVETTALSLNQILLVDLVTLNRTSVPPVMEVPECFGDRYLCAKVRSLFLSFGCRFSAERDSPNSYPALLPLLSTDAMLRSGVVPVVDTNTLVENISRIQPKLSGSVLSFLHKNSALYDSCRCIAFRALSSYCREHSLSLQTKHLIILHILSNAYAGAVEHICASFAKTGAETLLFLPNSRVRIYQVLPFLRPIVEIGLSGALLIGIIAFTRLSLNWPWSREDIRQFCQEWPVNSSEPTAAREVAIQQLVDHVFFEDPSVVCMAARTQFEFINCAQEYDLLCLPRGSRWLASVPWIFDATQNLIDLTCERPPDSQVTLTLDAVSPTWT
jgi:hypothetical protein